jgi:hypothetical protein
VKWLNKEEVEVELTWKSDKYNETLIAVFVPGLLDDMFSYQNSESGLHKLKGLGMKIAGIHYGHLQ